MRVILILFFVFSSLFAMAQDQQMAYEYFRKGEYEKAGNIYNTLFEKNPYNTYYLLKLIDCKQQLEAFSEAENLIQNQLQQYPSQAHFYVELGYNFALQHENDKATKYYKKALQELEKNKYAAYSIAKTFKENHLLDYALTAFDRATKLNPEANYTFQVAAIYGEKGDVKNMLDTYLNTIDVDEKYTKTVIRFVGSFITDDAENENNVLFKNLILKRLQENPKNAWNQLLSWLFMQQKDFSKAFIQEKALYARTQENLSSIIQLSNIAFDNKDYEATQKITDYIIKKSAQQNVILNAKLMQINISRALNEDPKLVEGKYNAVFNEYGKSINTLDLLISYADFLTFDKKNPKEATIDLKNALKLPLNKFQQASVKLKLGEILVFNNAFNSALIYFSQVQTGLKNHILAQEARFKVAQTSYFKGDFDWAETQLKVLKGSTSQLIANDALDLSLIISDNSVQDSLKTALKQYSKADLLAYQQKNKEAIEVLNSILNEHKGHSIEDETLFKQAKVYEELEQYENAENNYLKIIEINVEDILVDDAYFSLANLYLKQNKLEKAKEYFQKIIFDFPTSIHLVEARKKFRKLRGDLIN